MGKCQTRIIDVHAMYNFVFQLTVPDPETIQCPKSLLGWGHPEREHTVHVQTNFKLVFLYNTHMSCDLPRCLQEYPQWISILLLTERENCTKCLRRRCPRTSAPESSSWITFRPR